MRLKRKIICDICRREIKYERVNNHYEYFGLISWMLQDGKVGGRDFQVHHKVSCDLRDDAYTMELYVALGPHGMATLVHFMTDPHADRESLEALMHRLYFTNGELDPPKTVFDPKCKDKLWGYVDA